MHPTPDPLTDPVGVVTELVCQLDPGLDRSAIERVVTAVAGGRAKRRRLAQALLADPSVLVAGRSPAPRVVGDLLIALRHAGAVGISAPVCAQCSKALRTLQRRGEHWYCAGCGHRREPCAGCGQTRTVTYRDRHARPRCKRCPPGEGRDPTQVITELVAGIDPSLPAAAVRSAVNAAVAQPGRRHQLAWARWSGRAGARDRPARAACRDTPALTKAVA